MGLTGFKAFIEENSKKNKKKGDEVDDITSQLLYPTGFIFSDFACGHKVTVYDDNDLPLYQYANVGIAGGTLNTVISKSQGGKTSFCIKAGASILEPYINGPLKRFYVNDDLNPKLGFDVIPVLQIADAEHSISMDYIKKLTNWKSSQLKKYCSLKQVNTDEELIQLVLDHCNYKKERMGRITMPVKDLFGEYIKCYPPTVIVIDSLTEIGIDTMSELSMESFKASVQNPSGMQRAKRITAITHFLNMYASKYNIIIFSINHINIDSRMSAMPLPKQYRGLRQGETLNGGERAIYLASNIIRFDVVKSVGDDKASKLNLGEGVKGFVSVMSYIKCKTNSNESSVFTVYTNETTHDPLLSTLYNAKERGLLPKSGNFFYLNQFPQYKFTLKTARKVFSEHPEMIPVLYDSAKRWCDPLLDTYENAKKEYEKKSEQDTPPLDELNESVEALYNSFGWD